CTGGPSYPYRRRRSRKFGHAGRDSSQARALSRRRGKWGGGPGGGTIGGLRSFSQWHGGGGPRGAWGLLGVGGRTPRYSQPVGIHYRRYVVCGDSVVLKTDERSLFGETFPA